jgi:stromal membrane-associated protein
MSGMNVWGAQPQQPVASSMASSDIWGGSSGAAGSVDLFGSSAATVTPQAKKDDAFGDIWGGFK